MKALSCNGGYRFKNPAHSFLYCLFKNSFANYSYQAYINYSVEVKTAQTQSTFWQVLLLYSKTYGSLGYISAIVGCSLAKVVRLQLL